MPARDESATSDSSLHARQGAAHWLATLSDERCTEEERRQFFDWLRGSTRHVDEFLRLSTLARRAGNRRLWPEAGPDDSVESLVAAARASANVARLDPRPDEADRGERLRGDARTRRWAIAASCACLLVLGALVLWTLRPGELFATEYSTRIGEQRSITLEDGSIVELNSRSRLRTRYTRDLRAVELLDGEAIFRVARDAARPFRVRTGVTDIVAIGTAFNVNANDTRTIVTVLEGRVRVDERLDAARSVAPERDALREVELAVGEQLIVARAQPMVRLSLNDTEKVTSWTERRLIFEDTPIAAAAAEFARYSPREIRVEDAELGARRITGVFDATDPASLVEFLGSDHTVEVEASAAGWTLRRRRTGP